MFKTLNPNDETCRSFNNPLSGMKGIKVCKVELCREYNDLLINVIKITHNNDLIPYATQEEREKSIVQFDKHISAK